MVGTFETTLGGNCQCLAQQSSRASAHPFLQENRTLTLDPGAPMDDDDVSFDVMPDRSWPRDTVVIIDAATGAVIAQFPSGWTSE